MLSHSLNVPLITDPKIVKANTTALYPSPNKIIIIDDISDTGNTLFKFTSIYGEHNIYIITIHEHSDTVFKPDFSVLLKEKKWIVYPWEVS
jgi:hypoxanthine phosphoribosyltransferase|tara:strand:- start:324 stop:596 length:273 start_codon:yes stop_codon:yes gene_type:complete